MSRFKVGNKVKCIENNWFTYNKGEIFIVKEKDLPRVNSRYSKDFIKLGGSMNKFEVGDTVKCIDLHNAHWREDEGRYKDTVYIPLVRGNPIEVIEIQNGMLMLDNRRLYNPECFIRVGGSMSKYNQLKGRIESLNDGWTKECDDILNEISSDPQYDISIPCGNKHPNTSLRYVTILNSQNTSKWIETFRYTDQCSKLEAFKQALLWLLDHSDVKQDDKQSKIDELQKQVDRLQVEIKELR